MLPSPIAATRTGEHPPASCQAHPAPASRPGHHSHRLRLGLLELLLCLLVAACLHGLSLSLAQPEVAQGLGQRYAPPPALPWSGWLTQLTPLEKSARAAWLLWSAPGWLPTAIGLGQFMLWLARRGRRWSLPVLLLLWGCMARVCGVPLPGPIAERLARVLAASANWAGLPAAWGDLAGGWPLLGTMAGLVVCQIASLGQRFGLPARRARPSSAIVPRCLAQAVLWPLWCLLTGLAWLMVADFAAGADPKARYFGIRGADAWWLANGLALLTTHFRRPIGAAWLRGVQAISSLAARPWGRSGLLAGCLLAACLLGWMGRSASAKPLPFLGLGLAMPHVSGEFLRLAACLALAWLLYRAGEWEVSGARWGRMLRALLWVGLMCLLGLFISHDGGPVLVLALVVLLLVGVALIRVLQPLRHRWAALLLAVVVAMTAIGAWRGVLVEVLPGLSPLAQVREQARHTPQLAAHDDQMRVVWLIEAAPAGGFGAGKTPWCGAAAQSGEAACEFGKGSLVSGAPLQLPEDFALAGHIARFGKPLSGLFVVLLLAWLLALPLAAMPRCQPPPGGVDASGMQGLAVFWLIAVTALAALAQTLLSVSGTLFWTPMSGVNLPLLSHGTTSLCAAATGLGLALAAEI